MGPFQIGDVVACNVDFYRSIKKDEHATVTNCHRYNGSRRDIRGKWIVTVKPGPNNGYELSRYQAQYFRFVSRPGIELAIIDTDTDPRDKMRAIGVEPVAHFCLRLPMRPAKKDNLDLQLQNAMAMKSARFKLCVNKMDAEEWVADRIQHNPKEKWIIFAASSIAEMPPPVVTFSTRQLGLL